MMASLLIAKRGEIAISSILPELVSGRGTARRSRVVEGQPRPRGFENPPNDGIHVTQYFRRRNAQRGHPQSCEPRIARFVALRPVAPFMRLPVDLDRKSGVAAKEVEDVATAWVLFPKLETRRSFAQSLPEQDFRKRQFATLLARVPDRARAFLRCNIPQHRPLPLHHASRGPPPPFPLEDHGTVAAYANRRRGLRGGICP